MIHRSETTYTAPTALPVTLEAPLDTRRMALYIGGMVISPFILGIGGWIASFGFWGEYQNTPTWGQALWFLTGMGVMITSLFAFLLCRRLVRAEEDHDKALKKIKIEYAAIDLESRRAGQQQVVVSNVKTYEFGPVLEPAKVFIAAAWLLLYGPSRPSAIQLSGQSLMWRIGSNDRELLRFTSEESTGRFLDLCADAGLIVGRGPRRAGELVPVDMETAMDRIGHAMLRAERGER